MSIEISARGINAVLDPAVGHIPHLAINGADVLHRAPWRDEADVQADRTLPMVDRRLGGSFLCAPFGLDDHGGGPPHGATANSRWIVKRQGPSAVTWQLAQNVQGARVTGQVWVNDAEPALYQRHIVWGGKGGMTFAHHPMFKVGAGARLRMSPKRLFATEAAALEVGVDFFKRDQWCDTPVLTRTDGMGWDVRTYPDGRCEDFVTCVEASTNGLGWTALHRPAFGDSVLVLKSVAELPLTLLWISNGGRPNSPWNGRHQGVLGIEDARCAGGLGFAAALKANRYDGLIKTAVALEEGPHVLHHAIVRIAGCDLIEEITVADGLRIRYENGAVADVPFETGFFP